jgi:hypothetical protein
MNGQATEVGAAPPEVSQVSISAPVNIPAATALSALLPLIYTLSGDLTGPQFNLIDGSLMLITFTGQLKATVRVKFEANPGSPASTITALYPF